MPADDKLCRQSRENRQGRGPELTPEEKAAAKERIGRNYGRQSEAVRRLHELGATHELQRLACGVGFYVPWCVKTDRKNGMDYVRLRRDNHAQWEIQEYARAKAGFAQTVAPAAWQSATDYRFEAMTLSRMETDALADIIAGTPVPEACSRHGLKDRELREFQAKLERLKRPPAK
jgi:thymidylate synthase (FAD)